MNQQRHKPGAISVVTLVLGSWSLLLSLLACDQQGKMAGELRIGVIAPVTGNVPGVGDSTVKAAELAVMEVNMAGGLDVAGQRYQLVLFVEDSANIPDTAVAAARKLINQDRVAAIIGPQISRNAIPVAAIAENAQIPMISPTSTNPATTAGKNFVFRMAYIDTFQGEAMARFALDELNAQRAAVLFDVANHYNRDLAEFFSQAFSAGGGQIVAYEPYTTGETDFSRQMAAILASAPQVLYLPNYANEVAVQAQQARASGIEAVLLGSDSWELKQLIDLPALDGAFVTTHYAADADYPAVQEFVDAFVQQYNDPPNNAAALTYDAFQLLFQAVQNQRQVDPESIQIGLSEIQEFRGVTGLMLYRGTGDPEKSAVILQIRDGVARYYKTVNP